ncbi:MAG TPA: rhomboid family intramembrane serine protease [Chitinophagaceae bacterium]|nr:rhomboid family intramembrane serine protease [Chitinophagaceae bacterium]
MTEFRPGRFQILPLVVKNLLIINVLVFLIQLAAHKITGTDAFTDQFALHYWRSDLFRPYQFITHMFLHGGWEHILFNMFALWMFGSVLENVWGPKKFIIFYLICGLGAALTYMVVLDLRFHHMLSQSGLTVDQVESYWIQYQNHLNYNFAALPQSIIQIWIEPTLGASGAIFGLLAAFGLLFPNSMIYLYFFFPMKAKWFVLIYIGIELYMGIRNSPADNVAHFAHLGGALFAFLLLKVWKKADRRNFY